MEPPTACAKLRRSGLGDALALTITLALLLAGCRSGGGDQREIAVALAVFPGEAARYLAFVREFERREQVRVNLIAHIPIPEKDMPIADYRGNFKGTLSFIKVIKRPDA